MRNTMIYQMKSLYVGTQIFENRCGCNNTENKEKNIILYHDRSWSIHETVLVESEHSFKQSSQSSQWFTAEQSPAKVDNDHSVYMTYKRRQLRQLFREKSVFHKDKNKEVESPENIIPAGSMPESG